MTVLTNTLIPAMAAVMAAVFLYFGNRYVANKSNEVGRANVLLESRKVDQETFDAFMKQYEADRLRSESERVRMQDRIDQSDRWLAMSLRHIQDLRNDMRAQRVVPRPFPEELRKVPFWMLSDSTPPGGTRIDVTE